MSEGHASLSDLLERPDAPDVREHLQACAPCRARARTVADLDSPEVLPGLDQARARMAEARRQVSASLSRSAGASPWNRDPSGDLEPGRRLDRYVVEARLGHGGMGTVYRVRHAELGSAHALKVLHQASGTLAGRLLREGRAQGRLRHPNVVPVTDVIDVDGSPGLVMELVEGPSLAAWLQEHGPPPLSEVERLGAQIIRGVAAAHRAGLVHRDLKPANVLLAPTDEGYVAKVTDFGLARVVDDPSGTGLGQPRSPMGTPSYMSPEQIRDAGAVDFRSDLFALGAVLYELATGRRAFAGLDVADIYARVRAGSYPPPQSVVPSLPPRLGTVLARALQVDPARRFASAEELLAAWRGEAPVVAPSRRRWTAALTAAAGVAVMAVGGAMVLAALPPAAEAPVAAARPPVERRLTALPDAYQIYAFAVSPDGSELAYGDSRGLWIQTIDSGSPRLVLDGGPFQNLDWFPDGERLLVSSEELGIRTVGRDGTGPTPLLDAAGRFVRLSPDGEHVAWTDAGGLWVADLATLKRRRLRPLAGADLTSGLAWSPSGQSLAAVHQSSTGQGAWLEVTAVDGSSTKTLVESRYLVTLGLTPLVWLPEDRLVYGLTVRQHQPDAAATLYVLDGASTAQDASAARPLHEWQGFHVTQLRASADGRRMVVARITGRKTAFVLPLDDPDARAPLGAEEWEEVPMGWWSADEVLVASDRPGAGLYRRPLGGGETTLLEEGPVAGSRADRVGDSLVHWVVEKGPPWSLLVVQWDASTGARRELYRHEGFAGFGGSDGLYQVRCRPPGERCLLSEPSGDHLVFRWLDVGSGALGPVELEVPVDAVRVTWDLSPGGNRVAIASGSPGSLEIRDLRTGGVEHVRMDVEVPYYVTWAPDASSLYISGLKESAREPYQLVEVDLRGGSRTLWSNMSWYLYAPEPSPDGRNMVLGAYTFDDDLWLLEGIQP